MNLFEVENLAALGASKDLNGTRLKDEKGSFGNLIFAFLKLKQQIHNLFGMTSRHNGIKMHVQIFNSPA